MCSFQHQNPQASFQGSLSAGTSRLCRKRLITVVKREKDSRGNFIVYNYITVFPEAKEALFSLQPSQTAFLDLLDKSVPNRQSWRRLRKFCRCATAIYRANGRSFGHLLSARWCAFSSYHQKMNLTVLLLPAVVCIGAKQLESGPEGIFTLEGKQHHDKYIELKSYNLVLLVLKDY